MSSFYKRIIAKKILSGLVNSQRAADTQQLERRLRRIIRVPPVRKDPNERNSQLVIELSALKEYLNGKSFDINQLQTKGDMTVQLEQDAVHIKTDPGQFIKKVLEDIRSEKSSYGHIEPDDVKTRVCVDYSSPNIAKPFHVGHMRSTIIGNIICNMYEAAGHDVKRINFIGDWGTQFGLLSLGLAKYSDTEQLKLDPLYEFFRVYVKINQDVKSECGKESESTSPTYQEGLALFAKLEQGDESMLQIWKMVKELSVVHLDKMYERLGVHFTHVMPESNYKDRTEEVLQRLSQANLLQYSSDGVGYVPLDFPDSVGQATVVKSDGSSLYLTRDIASALDRQEKFAFDRVHYVVEQGQRSHFVKLVSILHRLGVPWANRPIDDIHIRFGRVKGMSTRQGNAVFLRDVLDEAKSRVIKSITSRSTSRVSQESLEDVADILGVTAIILQDVKANRVSDYTFSWEQMLNFKSDSGVFVQYCHSRLCSMLSGCGVEVTDDIDVSCVAHDDDLYGVVLHLARYPDIFQDSLTTLEPHIIVQYLFRLCHLVNVAYAFCPVKGQPIDIAQARLMVFVCARQVLGNCLRVLGQTPVEKM
ncbi:unnamed protein product [Candidula unifasciata]|uniref:Probable arginine--tRNA ligase, mitochondrial n=1 Tax=Candidula unifasciata TaxID=100452 RepID=A0A8S4A5M4_9EUPU|nr:unnamed protein product [Candidula unifasciata]